ncbi:MAG: hypothetical protein WBF37_05345 [Dehalococcoidia bacterium]
MANRTILLAAIALAAGSFLSACGAGDEGEPTPTIARPTATAEPSVDIREVDFSEVSEVGDALEESGGELVEEDIQYVDLTGDGQEEAIVPLFSGGTAGNIALWVWGYVGEDLEALLAQPDSYKIVARVEDETLVLVDPVYGPDDPNCCPSELRNRYYEWDGSELALVDEEIVDNPDVAPKPE